MNTPRIVRPLSAAVLLLLAAAAAAPDYTGAYHGERLTVDLHADGNGGYAGTAATPAGQHFDLTGRDADGVLRGTFAAAGHPFDFTAKLAGDHLTFTTGGTAYELDRPAAAPPATEPSTVPKPFDTDLFTSTCPPGWTGEYAIGHGTSYAGPDHAQVLVDMVIPFQPPAAPGQPAPDPTKGPILAFTGPADALVRFAEQMSQHERAAGRPGADLGPVLAVHDLRPTHDDGRAAVVDYLRRKDGGPLKRAVARVECVPGLSADTPWYLEMTEVSAPTDAFDAMAATMADLLRSVHPLEDELHKRFVQETRDQSPPGTDPAARVAAADPTYAAERHARATRLLPFEKFYPDWAGHGPGGPATPADLAELDPAAPAGR